METYQFSRERDKIMMVLCYCDTHKIGCRMLCIEKSRDTVCEKEIFCRLGYDGYKLVVAESPAWEELRRNRFSHSDAHIIVIAPCSSTEERGEAVNAELRRRFREIEEDIENYASSFRNPRIHRRLRLISENEQTK